jgi:myosin-crossreactive antigen
MNDNDAPLSTGLDQISFFPLPGIEGLDIHVFDIDLERQIADAAVRFAPDKNVASHCHVSQTNMLILSGELVIYEDDGSERDRRTAGKYYRGKRNDTHKEGGGPDGAIVLYSVRGHGDIKIIEILDEKGSPIGALTFDDLVKIQALQG